MKTDFLPSSLGLLLLVLPVVLFLPACDSFLCGYGGPGCTAPGLEGPCGGRLVLGRPTESVFLYFDDTGARRAEVTSATTSDSTRLTISRLDEGTFLLTGTELGPARLEAVIDGWNEPQLFDLEITTSDMTMADGARCDAGPCRCEVARGYEASP